jgi:hypothetical protein
MLTPLIESGLKLNSSMVGNSMAYASYWGFTELPLPPTSLLEGMDKLSLKKIHSGRPYIFVMQLIRYVSKAALYRNLKKFDTAIDLRPEPEENIRNWLSKGKAYLEISWKDMEMIIIYIYHYFFLYDERAEVSMESSMANVLSQMDSAWERDPNIESIFTKAFIREKVPQLDREYLRQVWIHVAETYSRHIYKPKR